MKVGRRRTGSVMNGTYRPFGVTTPPTLIAAPQRQRSGIASAPWCGNGHVGDSPQANRALHAPQRQLAAAQQGQRVIMRASPSFSINILSTVREAPR
jgi:hypothetical protein